MKRLALLLLWPLASSAQPLDVGTYDVYNQDISVEGRLEGCSLVFTSLVRDHAYKSGALYMVNGSLAVRTLGRDDLLLTGKLGTRAVGDDGLPSGEWQAPVHFHFATKRGTTATPQTKLMDADTPGYRLLLVRATEAAVLPLVMELAELGEFKAGFNRTSGGQDVATTVQISVTLQRGANGQAERIKSPQTAIAFSDCVHRLTSQLVDRIKRK